MNAYDAKTTADEMSNIHIESTIGVSAKQGLYECSFRHISLGKKQELEQRGYTISMDTSFTPYKVEWRNAIEPVVPVEEHIEEPVVEEPVVEEHVAPIVEDLHLLGSVSEMPVVSNLVLEEHE